MRLFSVLLWGLGCASAPPPASTGALPTLDRPALAHPYRYRLLAPPGADRFEPSGAAAHEGTLWVVSDKDGWIASYALPLRPGANPATAGFQTPRLSPSLGTKLEAIAVTPDGVGLLLETFDRKVWRCPKLTTQGCAAPEPVDVEKAVAAIVERVPGPWRWISFESLASRGEVLWLGVRSYRNEGPVEVDVPWSQVVDQAGRVWTAAEETWTRDGLDYSLSDLVIDGETFWMTASFEASDGAREAHAPRSGVAGLLLRAAVDPETGLPGPARVCARLTGKPEGVAVWGPWVVLVFDQDGRRKGTVDGFPLEQTEDYAAIYAKESCP